MNDGGKGDGDYRARAERELDKRLAELKKLLDGESASERECAAVGITADAVLRFSDGSADDAQLQAADVRGTLIEKLARVRAALPVTHDRRAKHPHGGHRERLRESARNDAMLDGFSDVELLELLLAFAIPRKDTNPTAHALLDRYGSVLGVLRAPSAELAEFPMMTVHAATVLPLIASVCLFDRRPCIKISNPFDAADFFGSFYLGAERSGTHVAYLDADFRLISVEKYDINDLLPIRSIVGAALKRHARYVIPVRRDAEIFPDAFGLTDGVRKLTDVLSRAEVTLLDFLMFTDYGYYTLGTPPKTGEWYPQYVFVPVRAYASAPDAVEKLYGVGYGADDLRSQLSEWAAERAAVDNSQTIDKK